MTCTPSADPAEELTAKAAALAERFARPDVPDEPAVAAAPLKEPGGYVDLVFTDGRLARIVDARGVETEVGHWIQIDGANHLRLPWPVIRKALPDPTAPSAGRAHVGAGHTERAAAYLQHPKSGTSRAKVLGAFQRDYVRGGIGLIDEDLPGLTNLGLYTAAPRRTELLQNGWLRANGRTGITAAGCESKRWELTDEAIAELNLAPRIKES